MSRADLLAVRNAEKYRKPGGCSDSGKSVPALEQDVESVDAMAHIRARASMYVPGGVPRGDWLAGRLVSDILLSSCNSTAVATRVDDWWTVASDIDWMDQDSQVSVHQRFAEIIPFPEAGTNCMHSEVLISTFASDVVTCDRHSIFVIKGTEAQFAREEWKRHPEWARMVAFRLSAADPDECPT